ncbi:MAG: hypothetical protein AAF335_02975 [Bacteroidota bacterium]
MAAMAAVAAVAAVNDWLRFIFYFVFYSTKEAKDHSGAGLAFVRMVMEASGGKVSCYSKHGTKGSFTQFVLDFSKR